MSENPGLRPSARAVSCWVALSLLACTSSCTQHPEADPIATTAVQAEANSRRDDDTKLAAELARLDERVAVLEADAKLAAVKPSSTPGSWIIWEIRKVTANPNRFLFTTPVPQPRYAYDSQDACLDAGERVAKQSLGDAQSRSYVERRGDGTEWTVTMTCLPKGIDPRSN